MYVCVSQFSVTEAIISEGGQADFYLADARRTDFLTVWFERKAWNMVFCFWKPASVVFKEQVIISCLYDEVLSW